MQGAKVKSIPTSLHNVDSSRIPGAEHVWRWKASYSN